MRLQARTGHVIQTVTANGPDAAEAIAALRNGLRTSQPEQSSADMTHEIIHGLAAAPGIGIGAHRHPSL